MGSCNCNFEAAAHLIKNGESRRNFRSKFPLISTCSSSPQPKFDPVSPSTPSLSRQSWSNFGSDCYFRRGLKSPDNSGGGLFCWSLSHLAVSPSIKKAGPGYGTEVFQEKQLSNGVELLVLLHRMATIPRDITQRMEGKRALSA